MLLKNSKALEKLAAENANLFVKIASKIKEFISKLRKAQADMYGENKELHDSALKLREALKSLEEVQEVFDNALENSIRNMRNALAEAENAKAKANLDVLEKAAEEDSINVSEDSLQLSEEYDRFGNKYWHIETSKDIFAGLKSNKQIEKAAYDYLLENRDYNVVLDTVDGKKVKFIRLSADEFTKSKNSQNLKGNNPVVFKQKMRLIPSLQDLLLNANVNWHADDMKNHNLFKKRGFENYRGRLRIDDTIFNYVVRVGEASFGNIFYDINLEVDSYLPHAESASDIKGNESTSVPNISDSEQNVNSKLQNSEEISERDTEYLKLAKDPKKNAAQLRKLVAEAAEAAGFANVIRYHQTGKRFTKFNTDNPVAGAYDSETPNGIFFKDNDHDIGVGGDYVKTGRGGDIQMAVYLKTQNLLKFSNREEARSWYDKNIDGYKTVREEMGKALAPIEKEIDSIDTEFFEKESISEEEYDKQWEAAMDKLRKTENEYRSRLRKLLNEYFLNKNSGYDGIELEYDGHRYIDGKRENVHTYIVFDSTQAKSADLVTYDDNGNIIPLSERFNTGNDDLRFSEETADEFAENEKAAIEKALANMSDAEYNRIGWARTLFTREDVDKLSKVNGEKLKDGTVALKVNNKIVFSDGKAEAPTYYAVLVFDANTTKQVETSSFYYFNGEGFSSLSQNDIRNLIERGKRYGTYGFYQSSYKKVGKEYSVQAGLPTGSKGFADSGLLVVRGGVYSKDKGRVSRDIQGRGRVSNTVAAKSETASMTKARIDSLIEDSGAGNRTDYAQAWITSINPTDFLNMTLSEKGQNREYFDKMPGDYGSTVDEYDYIEGLKKRRDRLLFLQSITRAEMLSVTRQAVRKAESRL